MISQNMKNKIKQEIILELKNDESFRKAMATLLSEEFEDVDVVE